VSIEIITTTSIYKIAELYFKLKFVRYGIIGAISTGIHVTAAFAFIYFINKSLFLSNLFGFSWAYLFSYISQSKFVFESRISLEKALKYLFVQLFALLLSIELSNVADDFNIYLKVLLVVIILPIITFFIHKIWTFAKHE
jgi:putative flippase GtrA